MMLIVDETKKEIDLMIDFGYTSSMNFKPISF